MLRAYILLTCSYVRSRRNRTCGIWRIPIPVNNVSMVYWQNDMLLVCMHSFSFVLEIRGPTKNPEYMT